MIDLISGGREFQLVGAETAESSGAEGEFVMRNKKEIGVVRSQIADRALWYDGFD